MVIIGLTGSIGMGKSETARKFFANDVPVFDSDASVHELMAPDGAAYAPIIERFPDVLEDGAINRQVLGGLVFEDDQALADLEAIVHPLVQSARDKFLDLCKNLKSPLVVLDIPLLYETDAQNSCDLVVVVSSPLKIQSERVLARPGMTDEKFRSILARQVPDTTKRQRADYVIDTSGSHEQTNEQIVKLIATVRQRWELN